MTTIQSNYYEKAVELDEETAETLLEIYHEIAVQEGFEPDASETITILSDSHVYDTVAYHVENFGQDKVGFDQVSHLFE